MSATVQDPDLARTMRRLVIGALSGLALVGICHRLEAEIEGWSGRRYLQSLCPYVPHLDLRT